MKTFLIVLDNVLEKDHPDVDLAFYLSRRSKFVHMGSDVPLNKIKNIQEILLKIENLWLAKKVDDKFSYCEPYLIASTKWKYDYILFRKNNNFEEIVFNEEKFLFIELTVSVDYIKSAPNAMQPLHLTSGATGSDLFSTVDKIINRGETFGVDFSLNFKIPQGYFGLISGRSSIALKGIMTHVG